MSRQQARQISRPGSRASRSLASAGAAMTGGVQTKKMSRPGSKQSRGQTPLARGRGVDAYGHPVVMTRAEFGDTLQDRAEAEAKRVFELDEPQGDYYYPTPDEFIPHPEQDEDGDAHAGGAVNTFANTGVGIGDWKDKQDLHKADLFNKDTLPLVGDWSNARAKNDNYPLYTYQAKFDNMTY